ncbi:Xaa-Pro aminopeptidase 1 [Armadillidium vulgare]|nr:Xaa-Pro aminopeptidase 1 [Armadillidium vulgare]
MSPRNTSKLLKEIRSLMKNKSYVPCSLGAYIVPSEDAHQSEYLASWLQDTPSEGKWLSQQLESGSCVGVDPLLYNVRYWNELSKELSAYGLSLIPVKDNLVDLIWHDQPLTPSEVVYPLEIEFSGATIKEKVDAVRKRLKEEEATAVVLTALDDIAYTFNLRGSDIVYNPVFFSYSIITQTDVFLYIDEEKLTPAAKRHLQESEAKITVLPYENLFEDIDKLSFLISCRLLFSIFEGMRDCHVRDGAALCRFLCWLQEEAPKGEQTELSASKVLEQFRKYYSELSKELKYDKKCIIFREQKNYVGLSFETISSVGPNAAIIHYQPCEESDRKITTEEVYLVDSGGQYKDGTTDVTRTVHFGNPTEFEKECFTRVLKGVIAVASCVFPTKIKGNYLDTLARKSLWEVGLDFEHGTGHGIGMFLNVHEGPMGISWRPIHDDSGLEEGMFLSDEPGYYESGQFGIRIENIVEIVKAVTPYNHKSRGFLTFNTITMAPIQVKMIAPSMLTAEEIDWLNSYHAKVLESVGSLLLKEGQTQKLTIG